MSKEKYIATLVNCCLGDTLGMAVEGWKKEQIAKYVGRVTEPMDPVLVTDSKDNLIREDEFGKLKYYTKRLKKGDYTDDGILTIAITESIIKCGLDLWDSAECQYQAYLADFDSRGKPKSGFGGTTQKGFKNIGNGCSPLESGILTGLGNGPSMKMHPVGMYMHATEHYVEGLNFAEGVGQITHLDPRSVVGGVVQASAIYDLLNDINRDEFLESLVNISLRYERPLTAEHALVEKGNFTSRMVWIHDNCDASTDCAFEKLGAGSKSFESHPFALFMFQKYWDDPVSGLIETVNYGGDCDTTGAIYGALAGAKNGMVFPENWVSQIQNIDYIKELGKNIWEMRK